MLANLTLSAAHRANLQNRGLNDSEIDHRGYRTLPKEGRARLARDLHDRFGDDIMQVPGLCRKDGDRGRFLSIAGACGLLIPVRDLTERIIALRIRKDEGEPRYSWLSSVKYAGAGPSAPAHVPKGIGAPAKIVRLTEGELKADVAFSWSTLPTISVAGVGVWRPAVKILQALGCETVRLAFDGDSRSNKDVARALDTCASGLIAEGFAVELERWDERFKGIDDALSAGGAVEVVEAAAARQAIAAIVTAATGDVEPLVNRGEAWEGEHELLEPEEEYRDEWKPFPVHALPLIVREYVWAMSESIEIDPAAMALFSLVAIAGSIGNSRVIRLTGTWREPANMFGCLIADPSSRKSVALEFASEPVRKWNRERLADHRVAMTQYEADYSLWCAVNGKDENAETKLGGITRRPTIPTKRRVIVDDITVETFIRELSNNPRGLFVPADELRAWFSSFGKYAKSGAGSDECFWLRVFNGREYDYDRKTGDKTSIHLNYLTGSVCGGVQPDIWRSMACQAMYDSGMMGRILLCYPPKRLGSFSTYDPPAEIVGLYDALLTAILKLDAEPAMQADWVPRQMYLTPDALDLWASWCKASRKQQFDADGELASMIGKMEAYCARFALCFAVCDMVMGSIAGDIVEKEHVQSAIVLADWFQAEAERVYAFQKMEQGEVELSKITQKIREKGGSITPRELWMGHRSKWKTTKHAKFALEKLVEKTMVTVDRRGRYYLVGHQSPAKTGGT